MALITGGMTGLGLVASYEHAMAGRERIVAVSKSAYMNPGEHEAHLLDVIEDIATHYIIRCDIGDAGAWSDALAFANNIGSHEDYNPKATVNDAQQQLQQMDSLDVIVVLISNLKGMLEIGTPIEASKLNRVLFFRNNMSRGLTETIERIKTQPVDLGTQTRLLHFQDCLRELSQLIDLFRQRGLVEEPRGNADSDPFGRFFAAEAAAPKRVQSAMREGPSSKVAGNDRTTEEREAGASKDMLLEIVEKELALQRSKEMAAGSSKAAGPMVESQLEKDIVPGRTGNNRRPAGVDSTVQPSEPGERTSDEVDKPPEVTSTCESCGQECAKSRFICSECQRAAERSVLEDAISRAKEEAQLKAQREAERKARREEAERKAKQEAEQKAKEAEEQRARDEAAKKAREEAEQKAKAEAERRAREEQLRQAQEEALRKEAEEKAKAEAEVKSQDDVVCPKGHALQPFKTQAGFPCDVCDAESVNGATMWGCRHKDSRDCRTCDYDICERCSRTRVRRKLRAQGEAV